MELYFASGRNEYYKSHSKSNNKIQSKKYNTVRTVPKSNPKFVGS